MESGTSRVDVAGAGEGAGNWQFINICEPSQVKDGEFKAQVKKSAMQGYRRQKRVKCVRDYQRESNITMKQEAVRKSTGPSTAEGSPPPEIPFSVVKFKLQSKTDRRTLKLSRSNKKWSLDPFGATPVNNPLSHHLTDHFVFAFAPAFLPIDRCLDQNPVNCLWAKTALSSIVLFNSILSCAAVRLDRLYGRKSSPEALYFKGETIRLLKIVLKSPEQSASDATIAAVALLAAHENMVGDSPEIGLHLNALEKMVELRGGWTKLGLRGTLAMFIRWQDLISSQVMGTGPCFAYPNVAIAEALPKSLVEQTERDRKHSIPSLASDISDFTVSTGDACGAIVAIVHDIRRLTLIVEGFNSSARGATPAEMLSFSKSRSALEYRLLSSPDPDLRPPSSPSDQHLWKSFRFAALIYINHVLHEFDHVFGVLDKLKRKLMDCLARREAAMAGTTIGVRTDMSRPSSDVLIWILFMGGLVASNHEERLWFAKRIAVAMRRLGLVKWEDVEGCLMRIVWFRSMNDATCTGLWLVLQGQTRGCKFLETTTDISFI